MGTLTVENRDESSMNKLGLHSKPQSYELLKKPHFFKRRLLDLQSYLIITENVVKKNCMEIPV